MSEDNQLPRCDEPSNTIQQTFNQTLCVPDWQDLSAAKQRDLYSELLDDDELNELIKIRDSLDDAVPDFDEAGTIGEQLYSVFGSLDVVISNYIVHVYHHIE